MLDYLDQTTRGLGPDEKAARLVNMRKYRVAHDFIRMALISLEMDLPNEASQELIIAANAIVYAIRKARPAGEPGSEARS